MGNFQTALSALRASSTAIEAVGNNLANINTTGFKRSTVAFSDVFSSIGGSGRTQIGNGVGRVYTDRTFDQGAITSTNSSMDAAVQGPGFFVVRDSSGTAATSNANLYTRDGHFHIGQDGTLRTVEGLRVQGWVADPQTGKVNTAAPVQDIEIPLGASLPATPTTTLEIGANLDASAAADSVLSIPVEIVDSLGGVHNLTLTMTKDASPNTWNLSLSSSDPAIQDADDLTGLLSVDTLSFVDGRLDPASDLAITISGLTFTDESGIPAAADINWNLWTTPPSGDPPAGGTSGLTQYSQASVISAIEQNGVVAGLLADARIADGGKIIGRFTNGVEVEIARLALSAVRNPDSLVGVGGNIFRAGTESTILPPVDADTGSAGNIAGQALEGSNVDIAHEFTELITFQRGYQANSRVITTIDELTQETINLKR
jgi:flagellar hook protein FlgE